MKGTAVEWLAEKYNYVTWLRNRDEVSAEQGDRLRKIYLEKAKEMEKEQIKEAYKIIDLDIQHTDVGEINSEQYYQETYGE